MSDRERRKRKDVFPDLSEDRISFHMPGHKGRLIFSDVPNAFLKYDVTELPEMDNLVLPETWIKALTKSISDFYGSAMSRISVGGSTACILSAILGTAKYYETLAKKELDKEADVITGGKKNTEKVVRALLNRNAHISVYNAVEIAGIDACYLAPEEKSGVPSHFDTKKFKSLLETAPDMLILTYPFYQGGLYDIETMIKIARRERPDITIIVDEAHGAHLVLAEFFHGKKLSALSLGADIVIQSLHKTLPVLGQTAVLHYGRTPKGRELAAQCREIHSIEWYMKALQTTSPSYLLLKSISEMMELLESRGDELYRDLVRHIRNFYARTGIEPFDYEGFAVQDESKLLLPFSDQNLFIERGIYPEMELDGRILFLSSIANTDSDFECLAEATFELKAKRTDLPKSADSVEGHLERDSEQHFERYAEGYAKRHFENDRAAIRDGRLLRYGTGCRENSVEFFAKDAVGMRSAETLVLYPPGTPLVSVGELFKREIAEMLGDTVVRVYLS